ncbi:MAG: Immunoglobulin A1 protease [Candidatus Ordinivivax streblomastigis]|uniref:Immunoglobulin A1 protease n=1 Tax=Candidatus Ordinivivax streblomastigis TaxID=2540710 RepID=A0A5M8NZA7_9BACT|nr:MAG: Immunoglobulin A1 protease [Candidatus Ordinivivax streblomastigis]
MKKIITITLALLFTFAGMLQAQETVRSLQIGSEKIILDAGIPYRITHTQSGESGSFSLFRDNNATAVGTYPETTVVTPLVEVFDITVDETEIALLNEELEFSLVITADVLPAIQLPAWIHDKDGSDNTPALGEKTYTFVADALTTAGQRNADITITGGISLSRTVTVTQTQQITKISTPAELIAVNENLGGKFRLINDINMIGVTFTGIGSTATPFTGELDGNGFTVKNVTVSGGGDIKGFFNAVNGAKIEKLGLANLTIVAYDNVGGLIGENKGNTTIDQCYLTGTVTGHNGVGGLIGTNATKEGALTITNSYVDATIVGNEQAGAFIGQVLGGAWVNTEITNGYFNGSLTGTSWFTAPVIAILREWGDTRVTGFATIGNINGDRAARHIGGRWRGDCYIKTFTNNWYNTDATFTSRDEIGTLHHPNTTDNDLEKKNDDIVNIRTAAISKTATELKQQATYTGWNFTDVWTITEGSYPQLKNVTRQ